MKSQPLIAVYATLVANVRTAYYAARQYPSLFQEGLQWYTAHNATAQNMAVRYRISEQITCGVLSALSPNVRWERCLIDADLLLSTKLSGGDLNQIKITQYQANREKAIRIVEGETPINVLGGNKTRSFFTNLYDPTDPDEVTIDGHAVCIALNQRKPLKGIGTLSDQQYELFQDAYRDAALEIRKDSLDFDPLPCQVQAVCWTYWRALHNISSEIVLN